MYYFRGLLLLDWTVILAVTLDKFSAAVLVVGPGPRGRNNLTSCLQGELQ